MTSYENPFHESCFANEFDLKRVSVKYPDAFVPIHGDPTFSNIIYSSHNDKAYLIDPRGVFGNSQIFGDRYYDIAKLYIQPRDLMITLIKNSNLFLTRVMSFI